MSHISTITKNTFNKVFNNLAKELESNVSEIQLAICYSEGQQKFEAYRNFKKEKDILLGDYVGSVIDWSGGTIVIESTIAQAGARYAKELGVPLDNIRVIMKYNDGKLPDAVLLNGDEKVKKIDIETEFLK
jgi:hypothetical protein